MPNGTSDPVEEARYAYDRVQRDIGFDPCDPRLMADGTYREADRLFAALEAAIVQREAAKYREMLKELEWVTAYDDDNGGIYDQCSVCGNHKPEGHTPDCTLGNTLKEMEGV